MSTTAAHCRAIKLTASPCCLLTADLCRAQVWVVISASFTIHGSFLRRVFWAYSIPRAVPRAAASAPSGFEPNPVHTPSLTKLNAYFERKGYQAIVLTESA